MPTGKPQKYNLEKQIKICSKCKTEKSFEEFHSCNKTKSGCSAECIQCFSARRIKNYKSPRGRYNSYKAGAKKRRKEWNITYSQFKKYWNKSCYYCGIKINTIGLDRIDNNMDYFIDNIVSCCSDCNSAKRCMSEPEFLKWVESVYLHSIMPLKNNNFNKEEILT